LIGLVTAGGSSGLVTAGMVTASGRILNSGVGTGGISLVSDDCWWLHSLASARVVGDVTNSSDSGAVRLKAVETH
jgi:hypothetical protein